MNSNTAIYLIKSPSGKIYIGQTRNLKGRLSKYKGSHCKAQPMLYNSFKKYGFNSHSFIVLQYLPDDIDQQALNNIECFCISQHQGAGYPLLNVKGGGSNGRLSVESIEKIRKAIKIIFSQPEYRARMSALRKGKKPSELTKEKLRQANYKRVYTAHSPETKQKISIAKTGKKMGPPSAATREKIGNAQRGRKGRPMTDAQKEYRRQCSTGMKLPQYAKELIRSARSEPIKQYDLQGTFLKEWPSAKAACDQLGLCRGHMCNILKGNNTYKGYKWYKS